MITNRMKIFALVVLTSLNVVNYLDRSIISALLPFIRNDLRLTDAQLGLLHSAFTFSYLFSAPFLGLLGDRVSRRWLAAASVFLWSIATAASGMATSYSMLLAIRAGVGIGEAGYGPVAPTIISDFYSERVRSRMLSIYYVGIPLGSAIGIISGGDLGLRFGWRTAFWVAAVPGLMLALLTILIREPKRKETPAETPSVSETLRTLAATPSYVYNVLGTTAMTFATVGLAYWFPTFLSRERGWEITQATRFFGATTVVAGIAGTMFGGFIADFWQNRNRKSYFYVAALGMLLAVPLTLASLLIHGKAWVFPIVFLAVFFLFFNISPLNAAIISVVHPRMRATAMAMNILFIHLIGDAISTWAIGQASDLTGSLAMGMLVGPAAIMLGGIILLIGTKHLAVDQEKLETTLSGPSAAWPN
jgi:MFS transporter, Spinster family, sphingosine-1-phosphate transporter